MKELFFKSKSELGDNHALKFGTSGNSQFTPQNETYNSINLDTAVVINTVSFEPRKPPPSQADRHCPSVPRRVSRGLCSDLHEGRPAGRLAAPASPVAGSH